MNWSASRDTRNEKTDYRRFKFGAQERTLPRSAGPTGLIRPAFLALTFSAQALNFLGNSNKKTDYRRFTSGAQERTRTSTVFPPLGPEPSASTNSATWALPTINQLFLSCHCLFAAVFMRTISVRSELRNIGQ